MTVDYKVSVILNRPARDAACRRALNETGSLSHRTRGAAEKVAKARASLSFVESTTVSRVDTKHVNTYRVRDGKLKTYRQA